MAQLASERRHNATGRTDGKIEYARRYCTKSLAAWSDCPQPNQGRQNLRTREWLEAASGIECQPQVLENYSGAALLARSLLLTIVMIVNSNELLPDNDTQIAGDLT